MKPRQPDKQMKAAATRWCQFRQKDILEDERNRKKCDCPLTSEGAILLNKETFKPYENFNGIPKVHVHF